MTHTICSGLEKVHYSSTRDNEIECIRYDKFSHVSETSSTSSKDLLPCERRFGSSNIETVGVESYTLNWELAAHHSSHDSISARAQLRSSYSLYSKS